MARVIDITERLGLEGRPSIAIAGEEYEVNNTAGAVLRVMEIIGDGKDVTPADADAACAVLFGAKKAGELKDRLSFDDLLIVLAIAIEMGTDGGKDGVEGEAGTPATT